MIMSIKSIRATNFKSFKEVEVDLHPLNILIGANASGKSSFISIITFLSNIARYGLENAISMYGGANFIQNMKIGPEENTSIRVVLNLINRIVVGRAENKQIGIDSNEMTYEFSLSFNKKGEGFRIVEDRVTFNGNFFQLPSRKGEEAENIGQGSITIFNSKGKTRSSFELPLGLQLRQQDRYPPFLEGNSLPPQTIMLEIPDFFPPTIFSFFYNLSVYDIDPRLAKKAAAITGRVELDEDSGNLAIVLKNILSDKESKRRFINLMQDALPFIEKINVERSMDRSLLFNLQEKTIEN